MVGPKITYPGFPRWQNQLQDDFRWPSDSIQLAGGVFHRYEYL